MTALAAVLVDDGYVVYMPLLPEHGEDRRHRRVA